MGELEEFSDDKTIMLDYDFRRTPSLRSAFTILRMLQLHPVSMRDDRTKKGWHRVIELRESLSVPAHIAVQFALGSDRRRETLNLMRHLRTRESGMSPFQARRWNILYRLKLT